MALCRCRFDDDTLTTALPHSFDFDYSKCHNFHLSTVHVTTSSQLTPTLLVLPVLLLILHYTFLLSYILALHWMLQAWIDAHTAMQMKCHPCIVQSWNQISWGLLFCHHDTFILPGRHFPLKRFYHTQSYTLNSNNSEKRQSQHCPRRRTWTTSASRNLHHFHLLNQDGDL